MIREFCQHTAATAEETVLRFGNDVENNANFTKIRHEFDSARRSFLKIPEALNLIPNMNPEGMYVNKNLGLVNVQVYGFDYDYTLAHYSANLQSLIYYLAKDHIVNERTVL
ncbi:hypothetical protein MKW92_041696 [Papaver armeniacum]|nr:hypothetical protein MKW92_041696 [Papaver armeniacum]